MMHHIRNSIKFDRSRSVRPTHSVHRLVSIMTDVLICVLGFLSNVLIRFIGELYVTELILILLIPFLLVLRGRTLLRPELKRIFVLLGLWLFGQIISDAYNHIELLNRMRGAAAIVFLAIEIAGLTMLLARSNRRKVMFVSAYAIGWIAMAPTRLFVEDDPWKFGYARGKLYARGEEKIACPKNVRTHLH